MPVQKARIRIEEGSEKVRAHVIVNGSVQGVFFRSSLRSQAKLLGVSGWTKNLLDGTVEAVFEGEKDLVDKLITFCWKGPPGAFIRDVKVEWLPPKFDLAGFEIRY